MPALGRKPMKYDARDWRMKDFLSVNDYKTTVTQKLWNLGKILDQGDTPHCVGFAWAQYGICEPVVDLFDNSDGDRIYYEAKVIDGEPNQEDGSTTRSGVQAMVNDGRVEANYAFANSIADIEAWVLNKGPVVTGTNWTYNMFTPDSKGFVKPTGFIAGGHEYLIVGADSQAKVFTFANSWGEGWGQKGFFYMTYKDYQKLFNAQGDACVSVELALTPEPVLSGWVIKSQTETEIVLVK